MLPVRSQIFLEKSASWGQGSKPQSFLFFFFFTVNVCPSQHQQTSNGDERFDWFNCPVDRLTAFERISLYFRNNGWGLNVTTLQEG